MSVGLIKCHAFAILETHRGFISVQEHREETLIYDVDVVKLNAMRNQRAPRGSSDQRAFEAAWCPLGAILGHRRRIPV